MGAGETTGDRARVWIVAIRTQRGKTRAQRTRTAVSRPIHVPSPEAINTWRVVGRTHGPGQIVQPPPPWWPMGHLVTGLRATWYDNEFGQIIDLHTIRIDTELSTLLYPIYPCLPYLPFPTVVDWKPKGKLWGVFGTWMKSCQEWVSQKG